MPAEMFFVAVDGRQLDGEHDMSQVRQLCTQYAGRQVMVWNEGLGSWTDPKTLPSFRVADVPAPAPAPAPTPAPAPAPAPAPPPPPAPAPRVMHPAEKPSAAAAALGGLVGEDAGALKGLLDFKFENLVAPKLLRILYVVLVVLCGLGALGGILGGLNTMFQGIRFGVFGIIVTGLVMTVISPVIAVFYLALMRVMLEGVHVLFQIREKLGKG
ncbi:MAG: DUF4282 domain-containing protein [Thermoanaerobaculia bacterium]|nr:DUF4282 domain-containing protein [Thermoanaerobaculia bacterium]